MGSHQPNCQCCSCLAERDRLAYLAARKGSNYPIPTREQIEYQARDGQWYDTERQARQVNARLAILEVAQDPDWLNATAPEHVADLLCQHLCALAPWLDDLNG